jgi:hypothetical protein
MMLWLSEQDKASRASSDVEACELGQAHLCAIQLKLLFKYKLIAVNMTTFGAGPWSATSALLLLLCFSLLLLHLHQTAAAAGEAYDKVARMLGLELKPNGGAALEAIARQGNPDAFPFGVPMKKYGNCDFSYAGLKTSVRLCIEKHLGSAEGVGKRASVTMQQQQQQAAAAAATAGNGGSSTEAADAASSSSSSSSDSAADDQQQQQLRADIAASFQKVAVQHLVMRLKRAITWAREECPEVQHLVVAGGVASNQYVRQQVSQVRRALMCCYVLQFGCASNQYVRHQVLLVRHAPACCVDCYFRCLSC